MAARAAPAPPPICRMWSTEQRHRAQAGFTLIEVMAVMAIIALIASLAVMVIPGTGRARLKAVTLETAALMRRERVAAMLTGRERRVALDGTARMLVGDGGGKVAIPRDVAFDLLGTDS